MRESVVEKKFVTEVKKRGGLAVKFVSPGLNGVPDRLVLFPGGRMAFVELIESALALESQIKRTGMWKSS